MSRPAIITKDCTVRRHTSMGDPMATLHLKKGTQVEILHEASEQDGYIDSLMCKTPNCFLVVVPNDLVQEYML